MTENRTSELKIPLEVVRRQAHDEISALVSGPEAPITFSKELPSTDILDRAIRNSQLVLSAMSHSPALMEFISRTHSIELGKKGLSERFKDLLGLTYENRRFAFSVIGDESTQKRPCIMHRIDSLGFGTSLSEIQEMWDRGNAQKEIKRLASLSEGEVYSSLLAVVS